MMFLSSCNHSKDFHRELETKTGKRIVIRETHSEGQSLSNIEIKSLDFEYNFDEIIRNTDPIHDVLIADLDGNGYDEFYIITVSAGSGSYGSVIGFASNRDKSLSMINFPEVQKNDPLFKGYMGHDSFTIEDQKLVRTFPIYREGDPNRKPTGGKQKIIYALHPGEAMWQLVIVNEY